MEVVLRPIHAVLATGVFEVMLRDGPWTRPDSAVAKNPGHTGPCGALGRWLPKASTWHCDMTWSPSPKNTASGAGQGPKMGFSVGGSPRTWMDLYKSGTTLHWFLAWLGRIAMTCWDRLVCDASGGVAGWSWGMPSPPNDTQPSRRQA